MTNQQGNVPLRDRAANIIREANAAVTRIQQRNEVYKPVVVHKTGEGHFTVRIEPTRGAVRQ